VADRLESAGSDTLLTQLKANNEVGGGELFYSLGSTPALHATFDLQVVSSARPR
jgi:hypothetical protein